MRIRVLTYMLLLMVALQSCVDDSYRGSADDPQANPPDRVPVVVVVGNPEDAPDLKSYTKGTGPITNINDWNDRPIYVYAFNRYLNSSFTALSSSDDVQCLIDGSKDEPGTYAGKKARLQNSGRIAEWMGPESNVWYPLGEHQTQHYDFFAYYIDDMQLPNSAYHRVNDLIRLDVEIDGSQDLMSAKAEVTESQLARFSEEEKTRILEYSYSYYTGARNVFPEFYFKHHLSKIDFEILPGYVENAVKYIYVEEVSVESKYKASFTVADRNVPTMQGLSFKEDRKDLYLAEKDGSELQQGHYGIETLRSTAQTGSPVHVGGSLLVAPGDSFLNAKITLREVRVDGTVVEQGRTNDLVLDLGAEIYEPGTRYVVRLTLYGALNIHTTIESTKWDSGGDIILDTDEKIE